MCRRLYLACVLGALALAAAPAWASAGAEQREGAQTLRSVEDGERPCGTLETDDYERIGEYAMGRMVGSPGAHASMDRLMAQMMGERAEGRMHVLMGRRFSRCGRGQVPGGFGGMMGAMGMIGGGFGPRGRGTTDAGGGRGAAGFPGMMDRRNFVDQDDDDWSAAAIIMTTLMLLLLVLAVAALLFWRPWRQAAGGKSSLEILQERFARGEIDIEDYGRRRRALGG